MIAGPPARWIAPSTPPPPASASLAALTIASAGIRVMSPWTSARTRSPTRNSEVTHGSLTVARDRCRPPLAEPAAAVLAAEQEHAPARRIDDQLRAGPPRWRGPGDRHRRERLGHGIDRVQVVVECRPEPATPEDHSAS